MRCRYLHQNAPGFILGVLFVTLSAGAAELGPCQDVNFVAGIDGSTQQYVLRLPPDFNDSQPHHLLIGLHGRGYDRWQYATETIRREIVAAREAAIKYRMILVSPDYRAPASWMGPKAEADLLQIINDIKKQYKIDKVFICGASMGGSSSLTFTVLHPDLVDGVVSMNGNANYLAYVTNDAIIASFGGAKAEIPLEYKKRSAEYWPELFTMPVGITASGKDDIVPPQSVLRLADVLKKMDRRVMLVYREDEGHQTRYDDARTVLSFVIESAAAPSPQTVQTSPGQPAQTPATSPDKKPGAELGPSHDVNFVADVDGSTQQYVLRLPAEFNNFQPHDLLVGLHGHGADRWQYAQATQWPEIVAARDFAADHNMILVSPDYRDKTSWMGPKAEADVVQIIRDVKNQYRINKTLICGASMGGTTSLTFAVLHPDLVDGVASMNGTANLLEYENFQDTISASFGGTKTQIPLEYKKRSAEYWPEHLTMPVGITTSGRDELVPSQSVRRLADILKKMDRCVMVIYRETEGHRTSYKDARTILEFVLDPNNAPRTK